MLNCANCGDSRPDFAPVEAAFCEDCGERLSPTATAASQTAAPPARMGVTWGGKQISAGIILTLVALFLAAASASVISSLYPSQEEAVATWISVHLTAMFIFGIVWFLGVRRSPDPLAVLGLISERLPSKRTVLLSIGVLAASLVSTSIYSVVVSWLGYEWLTPPSVDSDIAFDGAAVLLTFQALAFVTPLSEEIFFRGFVFGGLLNRLGPRRAMIGSALIFAAFHLSVSVFIPIFITGLFFAWLYWRTRSLWPVIFAHAAQNGLAVGVEVLGG